MTCAGVIRQAVAGVSRGCLSGRQSIGCCACARWAAIYTRFTPAGATRFCVNFCRGSGLRSGIRKHRKTGPVRGQNQGRAADTTASETRKGAGYDGGLAHTFHALRSLRIVQLANHRRPVQPPIHPREPTAAGLPDPRDRQERATSTRAVTQTFKAETSANSDPIRQAARGFTV